MHAVLQFEFVFAVFVIVAEWTRADTRPAPVVIVFVIFCLSVPSFAHLLGSSVYRLSCGERFAYDSLAE